MDNRTGFRRPRGPALLAAQARRSLGLPAEVNGLRDVPLPLAHVALGIAGCSLLTLLRVPLVGLAAGVVAATLVAATTGLVMLAYDRLVYPGDMRTAMDTAALPVAAVGGYAVVVDASLGWAPQLLAAVVTVGIIGLMPRLKRSPGVGAGSAVLHLGRDLAVVTVMLPLAVLAVAAALQEPARLCLAAVGVALVSYDSLRSDAVRRRLAVAGAALCAVVAVCAAATTVGASDEGSGTRAAVVLLMWYGLRGIASTLLQGRRSVLPMMEYLGVVVVGLLLLAGVAGG